MASLKLVFLALVFCCAANAHDPSENPNLFEGDIILTPEQQQRIKMGDFGFGSKNKDLWPNPRDIPYDMDYAFSREPKAQKALREAFEDYRKYTCIRFRKRRASDRNYLHFYFKKGYGCSSFVGMSRYDVNKISLDDGCWFKTTVMHEIAHSLGFYHEQSRPDRDSYIDVQWHNLQNGRKNNNFQKQVGNVNSRGFTYDLQSMMHYNSWAFASRTGAMTIKVRDSSRQYEIGQREGMSPGDQAQINHVYKCGNNYPKVPQPTRQTLSCHDAAGGCAKLKYNGACTQSTWQSWVKKSCRAMCGICSGTGGGTPRPWTPRPNPNTPRPNTPRPGGNCRDRVVDCYKNLNKCNWSGAWGTYMRQSCQKSCRFC